MRDLGPGGYYTVTPGINGVGTNAQLNVRDLRPGELIPVTEKDLEKLKSQYQYPLNLHPVRNTDDSFSV